MKARARNYQNFSDILEGLFLGPPGRLRLVRQTASAGTGPGTMSKRTTITIETETLVILQSKSAGWSWCADCAARVRTLRPSHLLHLRSLNLSPAQTPAQMPALHWIRSPDGSMRICLNSLLKLTANRGLPPLEFE
jgi:hypothetical protein